MRTRTFIPILSLPIMIMGQNNLFEYVQYDTEVTTSDTFVVLHGNIFSLHDQDQALTVTRVTHEIAEEWSCSICVGIACLPPFLDVYNLSLAAGDTSLFTLDIITNHTPGNGSWTMYVVDSTTMEVDSAQIALEVVAVDIDEISSPESFRISSVYPNPTNASFKFDLFAEQPGQYDVALFDLTGRIVLQRSYQVQSGRNHLAMQVYGIASGNYILQTSHEGKNSSKKVSLIK